MQPQQILDTVADALFKQKVPSIAMVNGGTKCLYRGPNGTKCGVGHLIPDDMYVPEMDYPKGGTGTSVAYMMKRCKVPDYFAANLPMLQLIQSIHDSSTASDVPFEETFLNTEFATLAEKYGLTYTERSFTE